MSSSAQLVRVLVGLSGDTRDLDVTTQVENLSSTLGIPIGRFHKFAISIGDQAFFDGSLGDALEIMGPGIPEVHVLLNLDVEGLLSAVMSDMKERRIVMRWNDWM